MNATVRFPASRAASAAATVFLSLTAASAGILQAGFTRVEITPQQPVQLSGYEVQTSRYAPEAEETLVREALKLLNELHANNS